jgi:ribulose-5-phosphate 4-epimerase/fuculose-1-phosphate aldolase
MSATQSLSAATDRRADAVSDEEWALRVRLAAAYRILDTLGWTETIYGHVTLRVPGADEHFLINPYGLRYDEVTASNLVKVDLEGLIIGPSNFPINPAGFVIHSAIHGARHDVGCVMHIHTVAGMAVAAQKHGLLPISMPATGFHGRIAYHDYEGPSIDLGERERLVRSLGDKKVLILRTHGLLTCGATLEEAFILMFRLQRACEIQVTAQAGGAPLIEPSQEVCERAAALTDEFLNANDGLPVGKLEFDSYMRLVERRDPAFQN